MEPIRETDRVLHPVAEADEDAVSALSPSSSRRSVTSLKSQPASNNPFAASLFRRSGYQRMPSGGEQELLEMMGPDVDDLGIRGTPKLSHRNSIPRVPVGSKTSSPETPNQGFLHTPTNSDVASPPIGSTLAPPPAAFNIDGSSRNLTAPPPARSSDSNKGGAFTEVWDAPPTGSDRNVLYDDPDRHASTINGDTPNIGPIPSTPGDLDSRKDVDDEYDDEIFYKKFAQPPTYCWSKQDIHQPRSSWLSMTIFVLSVYSTVMSGIWLVTAIIQPRWGRQISSKGGMLPSNATLVSAIIAKTIELSFVTVFISCLGQILTRRSLIKRAGGVTLAEMTMNRWVIQPGTLLTHYETIPYAGITLLGVLSLAATIAASLYTTSSDALVSPKLKYGNWEHTLLKGYVRSSYANAGYASKSCPSLLDNQDVPHSDESCLNVQFSGQSYRNLLGFMTTWTNINENGTSKINTLADRPAGTTLLYDNTTMYSSWIETEHGNVTEHFEEYGRIINNVTLALPHPGVYAAATNRVNDILQPDELSGVGEYAVRAGVVSPAINVMCVNMSPEELEPLVYTAWPNAKTNDTGVGKQQKGHLGWVDDVPTWTNEKGEPEYLNRTEVDDIFRWGPEYQRRPPVFEMYPADFNLLTNGTVWESDSIYMLGKTPNFANYTVCQLKSYTSPNCSTQFNISGTAGSSMKAHCEDPNDKDGYLRSFSDSPDWSRPSTDWRWMADQWRLSMDLNGGAANANASNARILTQLALKEPRLLPYLPSMAEAIAVYASPLEVLSAIDSPFVHWWDYDVPNNILGEPGDLRTFNASLITQQYTSGHVESWKAVFYIILVLVFAINLFCLFYFVLRSGLVTDFTEPQNMFALAVNSPPSVQLNGSCGGGPEQRDLVVPWRIAYVSSANHYFFEEANEKPWRGKYAKQAVSTSRDLRPTQGNSYKRLSSSRGWL